MRDDSHIPGYRVVIVTLDAHAAGPAARVSQRLADDFPGLTVTVHAAAEWAENPAALARAKDDVRHGDIVVANLLFIEEHITAILPELRGPPRRLRRDDRGDRRPADRAAHPDGRPRHVEAGFGRDAASQEAARVGQALGVVGREADEAPAPAAQDPEVHPRQGAGPAGLVPDHAVLAGRIGRQRRGDDPLPRLALFERPGLAHHACRRADRLPRRGPLPPGPAGAADRHGSGGTARSEGAGGDGRASDAAVLPPGFGHGALRRRHPRLRGEGDSLHPGLRRRSRRAAGDRGVLPRTCRRDGVADGFLADRRPRLQRQRGGGRGAQGPRRALPCRASARVPDAWPVGRRRTAGWGRSRRRC